MPECETGYFPPEDPATRGREEKPPLIKSNFGSKEVSVAFDSYKQQQGSADVPMNSPEEKQLLVKWLQERGEPSLELNAEIRSAIIDESRVLARRLKSGEVDQVRETISDMRGLLDKLEQGIPHES